MEAAAWVNGARRGAGLTQRQLAARSGVPQPTIARIESGRQVPRVDTLERLLDACGWELEMTPRRGEGGPEPDPAIGNTRAPFSVPRS